MFYELVRRSFMRLLYMMTQLFKKQIGDDIAVTLPGT